MGHERLVAMASAAHAQLTVYPVNFGEVFPATGGLPLPKRAPERQAYRMMELERWREEHNIELNLTPAHFPAVEKLAANTVVALRSIDRATGKTDGQQSSIRLVGLILASVWRDEKDIADEVVLADLLKQVGADAGKVLETAKQPETEARYVEDTANAIKRGVFGAPTYVIDDEIFWGQDRLSFVEKRLAG